MKTILVLFACAGAVYGQYAASASGSTTAAAEINSKPAFQTGTSDPANCTAGKDFFFNTSSILEKVCTATNAWSPGMLFGTALGAGVLHIAGSTQTATSSLIVAADITSATITGTQLASSVALAGSPTTTTQSADDNSTKIATTAYVDRMKARAIGFTLGDPTNSSALTTSYTAYVTVPFACTISAYNLLVDATDTTLRVKFWKVATGTAIPTVSNSISTSGLGVASGTAIHSTTLSDFTSTTVTANDIMAMNVSVANTAKMVQGTLQCDQ